MIKESSGVASVPELARDVRPVKEMESAEPTANELAVDEDPVALQRDALEAVVSKMSDHVQSIRRELSFSVEQETGELVIRVYDAETSELIRQIPNAEALDLSENFEKLPPGLLLKAQA